MAMKKLQSMFYIIPDCTLWERGESELCSDGPPGQCVTDQSVECIATWRLHEPTARHRMPLECNYHACPIYGYH